MAIGRTFKEAFQKGFRGLETDRTGWVIGATPADDRLDDGDLETRARRAPDARRRSGSSRSSGRCAGRHRVEEIASAAASIPGSSASCRSCSRPSAEWAARAGRDDDAARARGAPDDEAAGLLRRQLADCSTAVPEDEVRARRHAPRHPAGLQDGGHLRRRVSLAHAVPLLLLRRGERGRRRSGDQTVVILGSGPNRIGQGVEFDYCCVRAALAFRRAGLPHGDGELESRDGLHRLRHLRRALLRAADARGRARDRARSRSRSAWWCSSAGRRRSGWRAGLERPGVHDPRAPRPRRSTRPRIAAGSRRWPASSACAQPRAGTARSVRGGGRRGGADRLPGAGPALLRAGRARRWRSSTTTSRSGATSSARRGWRRSTRC